MSQRVPSRQRIFVRKLDAMQIAWRWFPKELHKVIVDYLMKVMCVSCGMPYDQVFACGCGVSRCAACTALECKTCLEECECCTNLKQLCFKCEGDEYLRCKECGWLDEMDGPLCRIYAPCSDSSCISFATCFSDLAYCNVHMPQNEPWVSYEEVLDLNKYGGTR